MLAFRLRFSNLLVPSTGHIYKHLGIPASLAFLYSSYYHWPKFKCQAQARRDARKEAHKSGSFWFTAPEMLYEVCKGMNLIEMSNPLIHHCVGLGSKSWRSLTSFTQITRLKVMSLHHDARREELGRGYAKLRGRLDVHELVSIAGIPLISCMEMIGWLFTASSDIETSINHKVRINHKYPRISDRLVCEPWGRMMQSNFSSDEEDEAASGMLILTACMGYHGIWASPEGILSTIQVGAGHSIMELAAASRNMRDFKGKVASWEGEKHGKYIFVYQCLFKLFIIWELALLSLMIHRTWMDMGRFEEVQVRESFPKLWATRTSTSCQAWRGQTKLFNMISKVTGGRAFEDWT